jgi:hypothetical protein
MPKKSQRGAARASRSAVTGLEPRKQATQAPEPPSALKATLIEASGWQARKEAVAPQEVALARDPDGVLGCPHSDLQGWTAHLAMTVGSISPHFTEELINQVAAICGSKEPQERDKHMHRALAFIGSQRPSNEVEAMLLAQIWATHRSAMQQHRRANSADLLQQFEAYAAVAVKMSRLFAEQVQTLAKLRNQGKQQVEVRHVYIDARTQTVTGGGGGVEFRDQPHAPALSRAAPAPAVWGEDAGGDTLQRGADTGAETLPDARRQKSRPRVRSS